MRHAHWIACLAALSLACSAGGGPVSGRDGGPGGGTDTGPGTGFDAGPPNPLVDSGPIVERDSGPRFDAGCEATTPLETTIIGDPPDMLIVMDVSGSMCTGLGLLPTGPSKMSIMKGALTDLTTSKDGRINFGLMTFPGSGECGPGAIRNGIAPRNASAVNATLASIPDGLLNCITSGGATPTAPSIDAARDYFATIPVNPVGRYAILATDGLPNCGPVDSEGNTTETVDETVTAIEALRAAGINTYVIGFGGGFTGGGDALDRMATAGGTGSPYNANSAAALDTALDTIAADVIPPSCTVELGGAMRDPELLQVSFDGGPFIPRNTARTSGWDYDAGSNTITFYGADCTRVQNGSVTNIDVDFGCPGPLI
ncbi:MAG: hypothetical protein AB8I08_24105 [Sandaracinaceae bacterium]